MNEEAHAVRWVRRLICGALHEDYSKWHWTENALHTICNRFVVLGTELSFLPDTDDRIEKVDCIQCLNKLKKMKEQLV